MSDHENQAKQLLVHYFRELAGAASMQWFRDYQTEIELIVEHIIAAAREPATTTADPLAGTYAFTREQLCDLLRKTVGWAYEYSEKHSYSQAMAVTTAVQGALEGLDAERLQWEQGEVIKPSQVLP